MIPYVRHITLLALLLSVAGAAASAMPAAGTEPITLLYYEPAGLKASPLPESLAANIKAKGISDLKITRGPGVQAGGLTNSFSAIGWNRTEPSREDSLATGAYMQFGFTVDAGHTVSLTTLDILLRRSSTASPMHLELQVSLDGFKTPGTIVSAFQYLGQASGTPPAKDPLLEDPFYYMHSVLTGRPNELTSPGDPIPTLDLSELAKLQSIPSGTEVSFRLYAWGTKDTSPGASLAFGRMIGPRLKGYVQATQAPAEVGTASKPAAGDTASAVSLLAGAGSGAGSGARSGLSGGDGSLRLLFMEKSDLHEPYGLLDLRASGLEHAMAIPMGTPAPSIRHIERAAGGWGGFDSGWWAYGVQEETVNDVTEWSIRRYFTPDGLRFLGTFGAPLYTTSGANWNYMTDITRNTDTGEMLLLKIRRLAGQGNGLFAYGSKDGNSWNMLRDDPVYTDQDVFSLVWNPALKRYVVYQTTFQSWQKRFADNIGNAVRRVLHIRTSADGLNWDPAYSVGFSSSGRFADPSTLIKPDELDPPDAEFYRMVPFWYVDRWIAMVLLYAPSPQNANPVEWGNGTHGPFLYAEWWTSTDGINWQRPYRGQNAMGEAANPILHNPIEVDGHLRFIINSHAYQIPIDRLAGVHSASNAAFSTRLFQMPGAPLYLNVAASHRTLPDPQLFAIDRQAYIMAELQDSVGNPISGYEMSNATFTNLDSTELKLEWNGKDGTELAGREVRLRLYFRDATVYGVRTK